MTGYAVFEPFGNYCASPHILTLEGPETWRLQLYEKIGFRLKNTFVESSQSEFIFDIRDIVRNTINAATIENSLLYLQFFLGFRFPHPEEVIDYLQKHRGLYDVTLFACTLTEEKFGSNAQVSLELYKDPEIDDQYLTIYIRQPEYEADIIEKIDSICKEYAPALISEDGYILVTTDFHPPLE